MLFDDTRKNEEGDYREGDETPVDRQDTIQNDHMGVMVKSFNIEFFLLKNISITWFSRGVLYSALGSSNINREV